MFICESLNEFKLLEHKIGEYSTIDEYGDFVFAEIFKNPIDLSGFKPNVRGISDLKGNLYIINDSKQIHKRLLDFLYRKGIITNASWNKINYCYDNIICWQRKQKENTLLLGESYLHTNLNNIEYFDQMINNVKNKNPNIQFIKNCIVNESIIPYLKPIDINSLNIINKKLYYLYELIKSKFNDAIIRQNKFYKNISEINCNGYTLSYHPFFGFGICEDDEGYLINEYLYNFEEVKNAFLDLINNGNEYKYIYHKTLTDQQMFYINDIIKEFSKEEIYEEFTHAVWNIVPKEIKNEAEKYGFNDTLFREHLYMFLKRLFKNNKIQESILPYLKPKKLSPKLQKQWQRKKDLENFDFFHGYDLKINRSEIEVEDSNGTTFKFDIIEDIDTLENAGIYWPSLSKEDKQELAEIIVANIEYVKEENNQIYITFNDAYEEFVKNCIINESTSPFKPKSYEELLQSLTAVAPLYVKIFTELFPDKKITMWNEVGHIYAQYNFDILNLRFNFCASYYDYNYKPLISFTIIEKDIIPTYYERTQINNKYQLIDFVNKWSNLDKSIQENKLKHNITYKEVYNLFYKNVDNVYSAKDIAKQYTQLKLHKLS